MNRSRWITRVLAAAAVLAALLVVAPAATANGPIVIETTEPYGTYGGIEFVRYTGRFHGLASDAYPVPFEIIAPADPARGNGALVIEPYYAHLTLARSGYLTPEFLHSHRFSYAAVGWHVPGINPLFEPTAWDVDEAVEILANFAQAMREDSVAHTMVGDLRTLYGVGGSMTTWPWFPFLDSDHAPLLDFALLVVPGWAEETFTPNPAANKIMVFVAEADVVTSAMSPDSHVEAFRTSAPNYRFYEVAGGQHMPDTPWMREVLQTEFLIDMSTTNPLDWTPVVRALLVAGHRWARWGVRPPRSAALRSAPTGEFDPVYQVEYGLNVETGIARDENGNALGGVRLPDLAIGRGQYIAYDYANPWGWFGKWYDLKCEPMPDGSVRFPSRRAYVRAFWRQTWRLRMRRFLLPGDAWQMIVGAIRSDVGRPGTCPSGTSTGSAPTTGAFATR